jgi:hypothetical protein
MKLIVTVAMALFATTTGLAQTSCARSAQLTDQQRIVQREIQERIDESLEAAEARDFTAGIHYFTPNLTLKLADGTRFSTASRSKKHSSAIPIGSFLSATRAVSRLSA